MPQYEKITEKETQEVTDNIEFVSVSSGKVGKTPWSNMLDAIKAKIAAWTFNLTTSNKTLPGALNELNTNNTWKIHKTYLEGKHSVTLPTVFSELHIIVFSVNSREITYSFSFIAQELTTNGRSYSNGYGWHIVTNSNVCQIQISQTNVYVKALYNGGENILDDAIMDIYYK